ncbi:MAG: hypothetical protein AAF694_16025 [Bacteroidota bacterium]
MIKWWKGGLCLLFSIGFLSETYAQEVSLHYIQEPESQDFGQISIEGLPKNTLSLLKEESLPFKEWATFFKVSVEGYERAIVGQYAVEENAIVFTPRFLPDPAISYQVRFTKKKLGEVISQAFPLEDYSWTVRFSQDLASPFLTKLSPEADTLPANILRLYLDFSHPMGLENPYEYIQLKDHAGRVIPEPFIEMEEGIWSRDRKRLTLLIHPGRIKQGVGPNLTMGEVFQKGQAYTLEVREDLVSQPFQKTFYITHPYREPIDIAQWVLDSIRLNTRDTLCITTQHLLDEPLSRRMVSIREMDGQEKAGSWRYHSHEKVLRFIPETQWASKAYHLEIEPNLEDVSGNTPMHVFDWQTGTGRPTAPRGNVLRIPFFVTNKD